MRLALTIAAVLFGIPLLTLGWLYATGGKLIVVHNPDAFAKQVSAIAYDGTYIERRDPETLKANGFTWMIFTPRVKGGLTVVCNGPEGFSTFPLGTPAKAAPMISDVTLNSCDQKVVHRYTPPQRQ